MRNAPEHVAHCDAVNAAKAEQRAAADRGDWVAAGLAALRYRNLVDGVDE